MTKEEANYLNKTNYISEVQNRCLKQGTQLLNGDQVLGYSRIRYIETASGDIDDFGRTERQRIILSSLFNQCKKKSIKQLTQSITNSLPFITTDLKAKQFLLYANIFSTNSFDVQTLVIPAKNTFKTQMIKNRSVLVADLKANKKELKILDT